MQLLHVKSEIQSDSLKSQYEYLLFTEKEVSTSFRSGLVISYS